MKMVKDYGKRLLAKGVHVSNNMFETNMNNNDLIIGTSGCGKTGGYIVPMLQHPTESMVVVDSKNNLVKKFSESLKAKGYQVHLIDFVNPKNSTCGYNPLQYVHRNSGGNPSDQDLKSLAYAIVPEMSTSDPYWSSAARRYLSLLLANVLIRLPKGQQNLQSVFRLHSYVCEYPQKAKDEMLHFIEEQPSGTNSSFANLVRQTFSLGAAEKTWACMTDFASTALSTYDSRELQYVFSRKKTLDFSMLGREKTVVFLNISDMDRAFDNIVNLFYLQLFRQLEEEASRNPDDRLRVPVRVVMDDFASGTVMDNFDKIISVIRSRDISVSIVIQSLSQLESLYGKGRAQTIINNCDHLLYMGGNDQDTLNFMATKVNKPASVVGQKPRDKMYLVTNGEPTELVDKVPPYSTLEA